jgi:hypothetical protein
LILLDDIPNAIHTPESLHMYFKNSARILSFFCNMNFFKVLAADAFVRFDKGELELDRVKEFERDEELDRVKEFERVKELVRFDLVLIVLDDDLISIIIVIDIKYCFQISYFTSLHFFLFFA